MARSITKNPSKLSTYKTSPNIMNVGNALTQHAFGKLDKPDYHGKQRKQTSAPLRLSSFGTTSSAVSIESTKTAPPSSVVFSIDSKKLMQQQHHQQHQQQDPELQCMDWSLGSSSSSNSTVSSGSYKRRSTTTKRSKARSYRTAAKSRNDLLPTMTTTSTTNGRSLTPPRRRRSRTASCASYGSAESFDGGVADTITMQSSSIMKKKTSIFPWIQKNSSSCQSLPLFDSKSEHNKGHPSGQFQDRPNMSNATTAAAAVATTKKYFHGGERNNLLIMRLLSFALFAWFLCDMYIEATGAAVHIENITSEEAMLMMKLQRLEQQALILHDNLVRVVDGSSDTNNQGQQEEDGTRRLTTANEAASSTDKHTELDMELIRVQKQQIQMMDEEVGLELISLQDQLQKNARQSIIGKYGDHPIQLDIELDFGATAGADAMEDGGVTNGISIELWPDTPYAASALLRQIEEGIWAGSRFRFGKGFSLKVSPKQTPRDIDMQTRLEFIEKHHSSSSTTTSTTSSSSRTERPHDTGTVSLMKGEKGGLSLILNLQDNYEQYQNHGVACIGKIIDGHDAMQALVNATRNSKRSDELISIKSITVNQPSKDQQQQQVQQQAELSSSEN